MGIGTDALVLNEDGLYNVGVGRLALCLNISGDYNTGFGYSAGQDIVTGSENTSIGAFSGTHSSYSNTGAFGYEAISTGNNQIMIGNSAILEIGGYAPWTEYSDARFKKNIRENIPGLEFILALRPVSFQWDIAGLDACVGARHPENESDFMRQSRADKEKIVYTGFLAQEVEQAAQNCGFDFSGVHAPANDHTPWSLSYSGFVVPLVKAMQEQQKIIEELKQQNREQAEINRKILSELEALKAK